MIPTTVNFTVKNSTSKLNIEKKKLFDFRKGSQVQSQNRKTTDFYGDYRNVAIIPKLFRDHGHKSKKPNFSSFFSTFVRDPELIM